MSTKRQMLAVENSAEASPAAKAIPDDPMHSIAAAVTALARADWPLGSVEAAAYLRCTIDTLRRIPAERLPRFQIGREVIFYKHDLLQYALTYCRVQPKPENPLASPRRRRPDSVLDGGRGRDSLKGKAS